MKGTPKDPKTGIIKMFKAIDQYYWSNLSPEAIAKKEENERRRKEKEVLDYRKQELKEVQKLLFYAYAEEYPSDFGRDNLIERSNALLQSVNPDELKNHSKLVKDTFNKYSEEINKNRGVRKTRQLKEGGVFSLGIMLVIFLGWRVYGYRKLALQFLSKRREWETNINTAMSKYTDFYTEKDIVSKLKDFSGKTKELYDSVTKEVDQIYLILEGLEKIKNNAVSASRRANLITFKPLIEAIKLLTTSSMIDTKNPRIALFGKPTEEIEINPVKVWVDLDGQYRGVIKNWNVMKEVAVNEDKSIEEILRYKEIEQCVMKGVQLGVNKFFIEEFEYIRNKSRFIKDINALRDDPIAFIKQVENANSHINEFLSNMEDVYTELEELNRAKDTSSNPKIPENVIFEEEDDPRHYLEVAVMNYEGLFQNIDSWRYCNANITAIRKQIKDILQSFREVKLYEQDLLKSKEWVKEYLIRLREEVKLIHDERDRLDDKFDELRKIYVWQQSFSFSDFSGYLVECERFYEETKYPECKRKLKAYLGEVQQYEGYLSDVKLMFEKCNSEKKKFENKIKAHDRSYYENQLKKYTSNTSINFRSFNYSANEPQDYEQLNRKLDQHLEEYETRVYKAKKEYEEEQDRERRFLEQQARVRRLQEEQDRERNRSYSSSGSSYDKKDSSSGKSYSSNDDSSSGGSYGGGSDSSSGGDW